MTADFEEVMEMFSLISSVTLGCVDVGFVSADDKVVSWVFSVTGAFGSEVNVANGERECLVVSSSCVKEVC